MKLDAGAERQKERALGLTLKTFRLAVLVQNLDAARGYIEAILEKGEMPPAWIEEAEDVSARCRRLSERISRELE